MRVLGIESTAHTFGAGVVLDGEVLSNVRDMYVPREGGIHPREAADHHVQVGGTVVRKALEEAGIGRDELDLVSFSRGPGLGPCLRIGATIARVISLKEKIPIVGANHCVAHIEIGRTMGCEDPVLLYASGGNTQIIAHVKGRYRVLGETLDIGIGNMLDKFGREVGLGFPAGPRIERLARGEGVENVFDGCGGTPEVIELPYSVKGMDVSFSGIMTAALAAFKKGGGIHSVCRSLQETTFSMLCEVTERALAHVGKEEVLLGGGVACNSRLKEMIEVMAFERGGRSFSPDRPLLVDNGAMIAYLGWLMHSAGVSHGMEETVVDQRFRTDQVDVSWREVETLSGISTPGTVDIIRGELPFPGAVLGRGAESTVEYLVFLGIPSVKKARVSKGYRVEEIERMLTPQRVRNESRMLSYIRGLGIRTPYVLDMDEKRGVLVLELLRGPRLASLLNVMRNEEQLACLEEMGRMVGRMHSGNVVHGDLTTSNFILLPEVEDDLLGLIDCSFSERTSELEKRGVDLRLLLETFMSTHCDLVGSMDSFWRGYDEEFDGSEDVRAKLDEIGSRGRYI